MKVRNVLLALTIIPVVLGVLMSLERGSPAFWGGSNVWFLEGVSNVGDVKDSGLVSSPEKVFGQEHLKPAANIKVIAYSRPKDKINSAEVEVRENGSFNIILFWCNEPYVFVFKKDDKVLLRTSPVYLSRLEGEEFVLVDGASMDYDAHEMGAYLKANLSPNAYTPRKMITNEFFGAYFIFNVAVLIILWVMYFVRKFRKQDKQIDQQEQV